MATEPVAESQYAQQLLEGEKIVLEMIASGAPLADTLDRLCRVIEEQSPGIISTILLLDLDGTRLWPTAGPSMSSVWTEAITPLPIGPAVGSCGTAAHRREPVVVSDVTADPLWVDYPEPILDLALSLDLRACWSTPFFAHNGDVLGTFAMYYREPRSPGLREWYLIDRATHLASIAVERARTEAALRESEERFSRAFQASPIIITITRFSDGRFIDVNDAFLRTFGFERSEVIGKTTLDLNIYRNPADRPRLMERLGQGNPVRGFETMVRTKSGALLDAIVFVEPIELAGERCLLGMAFDITDRKRADERLTASLHELEALATRLMRAQDEERRRIARDLHETTAQDLAALKMNLAALARSGAALSDKERILLAESAALAERSMSDLRTLSYLLHPPLLDEAGLSAALRWYVTGFSERSGIAVGLELPENFARLPQEMERTLFRIVQESLINIHRHAGSTTAAIAIHEEPGTLILEIHDHGQGVRKEILERLTAGDSTLGVGIAGMRERIKQLGGQLTILSSAQGTTVKAIVPIDKAHS